MWIRASKMSKNLYSQLSRKIKMKQGEFFKTKISKRAKWRKMPKCKKKKINQSKLKIKLISVSLVVIKAMKKCKI